MSAYYNEINLYAAQWLRNLIAAGHIAPGDVDDRSIADVRADDLRGYTQCHFFAGIGGWSIALRLAGWPDARPVWTGSCPCQPFSSAGSGKAADDSRHLWPAWFPLIGECRPPVVFGEQVEAAIGWGWLDAVFADLESEGYACGASVLPACGVGAPHIRQRLWFVANASGADQWGYGRGPRSETNARGGEAWPPNGHAFGSASELGNTASCGRTRVGDQSAYAFARQASPWADCDWLPCKDGKARPVEPGSFPLASGVQRRASKLRAYGNAIVPQVAAEFIRATCAPHRRFEPPEAA